MANQVSRAMLEKQVAYLNKMIPGKDYSLEFAYRGVKLTTNGGSCNVLPTGFTTKPKLFRAIHYMLIGIGEAQDAS